MEDDQVVMRAALLFQSLMGEFSDYKDSDEGPEKDTRRDMLVQRLGRMSGRDQSITLLFVFDMLHQIGPDRLTKVLEEAIAAQETAEAAEPSPAPTA